MDIKEWIESTGRESKFTDKGVIQLLQELSDYKDEQSLPIDSAVGSSLTTEKLVTIEKKIDKALDEL